MRPLHAWQLLAALLACMSTAALAEPIGYAAGFSELYRVNMANGQATRIGPVAGINFNDVEGLAFAPNGLLYGVADGTRVVGSGTDFLIRISTTTGVGALVGQLPGLQNLGTGPNFALDYGLAFTCDGRLWMSSTTIGDLWEVDPNSGAVRRIGNTGRSISGLAARGNTLYGVSIDPQPSLYRIDLDSAATTLLGPLGVGGQVNNAGLDFDSAGQLWATLDEIGAPSRLARIDPWTGAGTVIGAFSVTDRPFKALALAPPGGCAGSADPAPIPGPGLPLLALLAGIAAALGGRRLSRS
jgi:hypothetical protein